MKNEENNQPTSTDTTNHLQEILDGFNERIKTMETQLAVQDRVLGALLPEGAKLLKEQGPNGETERVYIPVSYTHLTLPTNREV